MIDRKKLNGFDQNWWINDEKWWISWTSWIKGLAYGKLQATIDFPMKYNGFL